MTRINCIIEDHAREMTMGMGTTPEFHTHFVNTMAREDGAWTAEECEDG